MTSSAVKFISACLWLSALLEYEWAQDVVNNSQENSVRVSNTGSTFLTKIGYIRNRRASTNGVASFCLTPPQPVNGEYKLGRYFCEDRMECNVSVGFSLELGSTLVYRCNSRYSIEGKSEVYCRSQGKWSPIPECVKVKCNSLNSASTMASCTYVGKKINCDSPMPLGTRAQVTCRSGYKKDTDFVTTHDGVFVTTRREFVFCNKKGKWSPQPIRCIPVCGVAITNYTMPVFAGTPARIRDSPWQASLFEEIGSSSKSNKVFACGATVIRASLLLTAARCVYNEKIRITTDPAKLFVITGNLFREYDSPARDSNVVRKATVKNVYISCNYYGLTGNYASDIALLELHEPLEFSERLLPACLDDSEYNEQFLEPGVYGRVTGFGRAETGTTSGILQTATVPYISHSQCRTSKNAARNTAFISSDKFCAGFNNGSAVCVGDSGSGLMFEKGGLWYVMGLVNVGLGVNTDSGENMCDKYSYTLYTKVSIYIDWIQDVMSYVERNQRYPSCIHDSQTSTANSTTPSLQMNSCLAPQQPANGERKLHRKYCEDDSSMDCNISPGTKVEPGSQLVYRCVSGFTIRGNTDIRCLANGEWESFPTCDGDSCDLINGSLGVCTFLKDCQPLLEELKAGRPPNQHCGFFGNDPIVCCPISSPVVTTTSRPPHTEDPVSDGRGAIARQKCMEWSRNVNTSTCPTFFADNKRPVDLTGSLEKTRARRMEFPYMVAIGFVPRGGSIRWNCDGTLISEIFVMTRGWCATTGWWGAPGWVRFGDLNLVLSDDEANPEVRRIAERIPHPNYQQNRALYNDIGLLRLDSPVIFDDWIRPACLHTAPIISGTQEAIGTGWGYLHFADSVRSDYLIKSILPFVNIQTCNAKWSDDKVVKLPNGIDGDRMICAGAGNGGPCGDQGGPLVIQSMEERCMYDVVGITSFAESCDREIPTIYTRVYHYVPWIESIVWKGG